MSRSESRHADGGHKTVDAPARKNRVIPVINNTIRNLALTVFDYGLLSIVSTTLRRNYMDPAVAVTGNSVRGARRLNRFWHDRFLVDISTRYSFLKELRCL